MKAVKTEVWKLKSQAWRRVRDLTSANLRDQLVDLVWAPINDKVEVGILVPVKVSSLRDEL